MSEPLISDEELWTEWDTCYKGGPMPSTFARRIEALVRKRLAERLCDERDRIRLDECTEDEAAYKEAMDYAARIVESDSE